MPPVLPGFARREAGRVAFRDGPTPLSFQFDGLRSTDGHAITVYVRAAVRPVDRPADVQLFTEQFLIGRDTVTSDEIRGHLFGTLAATAGEWVADRTAAAAVNAPADLDTVLRRRADGAAFGCGLEIVHPWQVTLDSPSLRADRDRQQSRTRQLADADHAAKLAERLATAGPAHRLAIDDQSALLPTLLAARAPAAALLSAGPNLVVVDPAGDLRILAAPPDVGPLRCVRRLNDGTVALGGTSGVAILNADFSVARVLPGGGASGRGFNSVTRFAGRGEVVATHGELGLVVWPDGGPPHTFATPGPARAATAVGDAIWFAAGAAVCGFDGEMVRPILDGSSAVLAVLPVDDVVVIVRQDGRLQTLDIATQRVIHESRRPGPVVAATAFDVGGLRAILLADDRGDLDAVTAEGRELSRVAVRTGGVRMVGVVGNTIATVPTDRTTLVLRPADAGEATRTLNVLARVGHHITDLAAIG